MARIVSIDKSTGKIVLELDKDEMMTPMSVQDHLLTQEEDIPGSDKWSQLKPVELGAVIADYLKENPTILEFVAKVNDYWIAKKYMTLQRVLCKSGILTTEEIDGLKSMIEG